MSTTIYTYDPKHFWTLLFSMDELYDSKYEEADDEMRSKVISVVTKAFANDYQLSDRFVSMVSLPLLDSLEYLFRTSDFTIVHSRQKDNDSLRATLVAMMMKWRHDDPSLFSDIEFEHIWQFSVFLCEQLRGVAVFPFDVGAHHAEIAPERIQFSPHSWRWRVSRALLMECIIRKYGGKEDENSVRQIRIAKALCAQVCVFFGGEGGGSCVRFFLR